MEKFIDVVGYEGKYLVSNLGRVLSVKRTVIGRNGAEYTIKERFLKPKLDRYGYLICGLSSNSKTKTTTVHRLVAKAFLEQPEGKNCVNHKNGIKTDNRVENLEWVTISENNKHSYQVLGRKPNWNRVGTSGEGAIRNKKVRMIMPNGEYKDFYSVVNAVSETGISMPVIKRITGGRQKQTRYGIIFKYI